MPTEADAGLCRRILNVKQSPPNPLQWCCQLSCGHDQWVTAHRSPRRKFLYCDRCIAAERVRANANQTEK